MIILIDVWCFNGIDLNQNVADIKKLKMVGICTVKGVLMCTKKKLCNVKGLSEVKVGITSFFAINLPV